MIVIVLASAAAQDLRQMRISDWHLYILFARALAGPAASLLGFPFTPAAPAGVQSILFALICAAAILLQRRSGIWLMGGGDLKLLAALVLNIGWQSLYRSLAAAGLFSLIWFVLAGISGCAGNERPGQEGSSVSRAVPLAPGILMGYLLQLSMD